MNKDNFPHENPGRDEGNPVNRTESSNDEVIRGKNSIKTDRGTAILHVYEDHHPTPKKNY